MREFLPLLRQVRALAPLLAAATQLGESLEPADTLAQRMAEAVHRLRAVAVPPLAEPALLGRLHALTSALDRIRNSLGVDPTEVGPAAVERAVAERTEKAAALLRRQPPQPPHELPYCPSAIAPPAVVQAATSKGAQALAAIAWKVPPAGTLAGAQAGLLAAALAKRMQGLGITAVRAAPCGTDCDAGRIARALG